MKKCTDRESKPRPEASMANALSLELRLPTSPQTHSNKFLEVASALLFQIVELLSTDISIGRLLEI